MVTLLTVLNNLEFDKMDQSYNVCNITKMGDFEMKIKYPEIFQKISNDNILFVFLESGFNVNTTEDSKLWMIPRSNLEMFKKVNNSKKGKNTGELKFCCL